MIDKTLLREDCINPIFVYKLSDTRYQARDAALKTIIEAASLTQMAAIVKKELTRKDQTVWPHILYLNMV